MLPAEARGRVQGFGHISNGSVGRLVWDRVRSGRPQKGREGIAKQVGLGGVLEVQPITDYALSREEKSVEEGGGQI